MPRTDVIQVTRPGKYSHQKVGPLADAKRKPAAVARLLTAARHPEEKQRKPGKTEASKSYFLGFDSSCPNSFVTISSGACSNLLRDTTHSIHIRDEA